MRKLLNKRINTRFILAALAAGGFTLPAVAQVTSKSAHPSTAHHSAKHSSTASSTKTSSGKSSANKATGSPNTVKNSAAKTSADKTSTPASKNSAGASSTTKKTTRKGAKGYSGKSSRRVKGQAAPAPERVNEIQDALAKNGSYSGTPTGKWDDSTVDAMRKFQSTHGLNPTGKMDARTLQKLGLGSETAGAGAPTPPPNTANRLLPSSNHRD